MTQEKPKKSSTTTAVPPAQPKPRTPAPLPVELRIAIMRTSRRLRAEASSDTVSPGQYSVLAAVAREPMTLRALADRENIAAPSMTRIVNALEASKLVERTSHPTDGRQVLVGITGAGAAALSEARTKRTEWLAKRVAKLSSEDRAVLRRAAAILAEMSAK